MPKSSFFFDDVANVEIGYILNLLIVMGITGSIGGIFYLYADSSSQQSIHTGFTDLGSQIARDITNMYITSIGSSNISLSLKRDIPITIGGKGYRIELKDAASSGGIASISMAEGGFSGYEIVTKLNPIDITVNASGAVYSGSGEMTIRMIKNNSGSWVWIN